MRFYISTIRNGREMIGVGQIVGNDHPSLKTLTGAILRARTNAEYYAKPGDVITVTKEADGVPDEEVFRITS